MKVTSDYFEEVTACERYIIVVQYGWITVKPGGMNV